MDPQTIEATAIARHPADLSPSFKRFFSEIRICHSHYHATFLASSAIFYFKCFPKFSKDYFCTFEYFLGMKEECSLCGVAFSPSSLIRCPRCRQLYCRNCTIFSWDKNVLRHVPMCLNCARRLVSPKRAKRFGTKYNPLSRYLARRQRYITHSTLTFTEIEKIIEDTLPSSALQHPQWWSNAASRVQAQAWLKVGWIVHELNLDDKTVIFKRVRRPEVRRGRKRRRDASALGGKPFRPPKPRAFRKKLPSKTRVAMAIARFENVERRRLSMRKYRGKFKPRSAFEKRLYKPEEKPKKDD